MKINGTFVGNTLIFTFLPRLRWEDRYNSYVCVLSMEPWGNNSQPSPLKLTNKHIKSSLINLHTNRNVNSTFCGLRGSFLTIKNTYLSIHQFCSISAGCPATSPWQRDSRKSFSRKYLQHKLLFLLHRLWIKQTISSTLDRATVY